MRYPREMMSQRHLVGHLSELIDRCRDLQRDDVPERLTIEHAAKHIEAEAMLNALLDLNPRGVASRHVQHNIGARRRAWLEGFQHARAGADASST